MIDGVAVPAWPATGSLAAGVGTLALVRYLARHRGKPGAGWFLATLLAQATWCFAYGLALLTFDPVVRRLLESLVWFGIVWTGVTFLAFALEYTGRETALQHGSGLGLWIVHWAAAAVGAETDFADRDPRGTVATIRLPLGDAWTASASAAASTVERETAIETAGE